MSISDAARGPNFAYLSGAKPSRLICPPEALSMCNRGAFSKGGDRVGD